MANRYAVQSCVIHVVGPPAFDDFITVGEIRDSASAVVVQTPSMFSASPTGTSGVPVQLSGYLARYPSGWVS